MDQNSLYVRDIQSRTKKRYFLGILARLEKYIKNSYAVYVARRNGATIGEFVSLPLSLAKKANANLTVGNHTSIQTDKLTLQVPLTIGNYVIIGRDVEILTGSHNVDSPDWESKRSELYIEDFVWISTGVMVLPSCPRISRGAVIAAGSVVVKTIKEMEIVGGNPTNFLRYRKEVHYNLCVEGLLGNDLKTYIRVRHNKLD